MYVFLDKGKDAKNLKKEFLCFKSYIDTHFPLEDFIGIFKILVTYCL